MLEVLDGQWAIGADTVLWCDALTVSGGEAVAVVGPGGAGKSLLLAGLAGFVPMAGTVLLDGRPLGSAPPQARVRAGIALAGQSAPLPDWLTVADALRLVQRRRRGGGWSRRSLWAALPGLDRVMEEELGNLGGWERCAAGLAAALRTGPSVVLLDEPGAGLGDHALERLRATLQRLLAGGLGVIIATRDGRHGASLAHRAHVLAAGQVGPAQPGRLPR